MGQPFNKLTATEKNQGGHLLNKRNLRVLSRIHNAWDILDLDSNKLINMRVLHY